MDRLKSNPKRQAVPTLRGFSYQIWQSVLRWLCITGNEAIYLEGAEDIDILGPGSAVTVQIKDTAGSGTVTLRSADVLDAITHFWEYQKANPGVTITFRFLTTAGRGRERPNPFGDVRGLDLWDSCKYPGTDTQLLKEFLASQDSLPADLRNLLSSADDEDLRHRLFRCIEWDTGSNPQPYVEEAVRRRVAEYGDRVFDLPPSEAAKIIPHLLQHVWDVVRRKDERRLDRLSFIDLFERVMAETVSKHELRHLRRSAQTAAQARTQFNIATPGYGEAGLRASRFFGSLLEPFSPPDTRQLVERHELVKSLHARLNASGILVLAGSTGMGKSTLASMVASSDTGSWHRLDMRGYTPDQIADRIYYAGRVISGGNGQIDTIIDDLNFDQRTSVYENALAEFIYSAKLGGGRIIITTQGRLPSRIVILYEIPAGSFVDVPLLSEDEVKQLAENYGCRAEHGLHAWTRIVFLYTRGHPLLAHARVRSLEGKGWPYPGPDDLKTTQDVEDIRQEFRRALREQMPEDARLLLYRLSILTSRFKREQALLMGEYPPPLRAPGESFDALIGPWVERNDATHFRLSPLLDNAASEVFSDFEVKELHGAAAKSFLAQGSIDLTEFDAVLLHGLLGEAKEPLATAAIMTFELEEAYWPSLCRLLAWFGHWRLGPGEKLLSSDRFVNLLLRRLQYKVVAELDPPRAPEVARIWEQEIREWDGSGAYPGSRHTMLFTFLNEILFDLQVPFPLKRVVEYLIEIIAFPQNSRVILPGQIDQRDAIEATISELATAETYLRATIGRCQTASSVTEFLTALDEQSGDVTKDIWELFAHDDYLVMLLVDQVWLDEVRSPSPDWPRCVDVLEWATRLALRRRATSLAACAYRAKAIVQEEYLEDTGGAWQTLDEGEVALGAKHLLLEDYRARIHYFGDRYADALDIWRRVLPQFESERNRARTFSFRDAEICAANLGDWREAAEFARKGEEAAHQPWLSAPTRAVEINQSNVIAFGYKADHAFALWKTGERAAAVSEFAQVLDALQDLPRLEDNIKSHMLYKRVGHAIGWMSHDIDGDPSFLEPAPGCFSNQEVFDEVKDTPIQPWALLWYLLAKLEFRLKLGDDIFRRFEEENAKVALPSAKIGHADLRISHAILNMRLNDLVPDCLDYWADLRAFASEQGVKTEGWSDASFLTSLLFTVLIITVGEDPSPSASIEKWKQDIAGREDLDKTLTAWLDYIQESLQADNHKRVTVLRDPSALPEYRLVAALLLSATEDLGVEDRFYANVLLVTSDLIDLRQYLATDKIASMVVNEWAQIAEHQRYALRAPSVTTGLILTACRDDSAHGLKKAAKVLMAAKDAVRTTLSEGVLDQLRRLAQ